MGNSFLYDRAFGTLIVCFLTIKKNLTEEKNHEVRIGTWILQVEVKPQHTAQHAKEERNVVYITNCIWAVIYRNVAERNHLYPGIQSDIDCKR